VLSYKAYFPGTSDGISAKLDKISSNADVAVLKLEAPTPPNVALLDLDERNEASVSGEPVVLIGYPTGIEGILARAGTDVAQKIADGTQSVNQMMSQIGCAETHTTDNNTRTHRRCAARQDCLRCRDHIGWIGRTAI